MAEANEETIDRAPGWQGRALIRQGKREEIIGLVAQVLAGLQVPVSMAMPLGAAREPWEVLSDRAGFGWREVETYAEMLRRELDLP